MNDIRAFITEQAPTTLIAVGYMQNGTVSLAQNFTQDHVAASKSLRLPQGFIGAEASPYFSLTDFIKRWPANPSLPRREVLMITSGIDVHDEPRTRCNNAEPSKHSRRWDTSEIANRTNGFVSGCTRERPRRI